MFLSATLLQFIISFRSWLALTLSFLPADISGTSGLWQVNICSNAKSVSVVREIGLEKCWNCIKDPTENGHFRRESTSVLSNQRTMAPSLTHRTGAMEGKNRKENSIAKTIKMANSTSEFLWFYHYNDFYLCKKDWFFFPVFTFFIKKKIKVSFTYAIKSENAL